MSETFGHSGTASPDSSQGEYNPMLFSTEQLLGRVSTCTLVKIVSVTNSGGLSPVGFVDVQPLVNQVDGANNAMPHGVVNHLPYFRLQGGANAVIIDPQVGDIGIAVFADHDISSVAASKKQSNPGSGRRFSMSDGLYIGGVLNGTPSQFIQFSGAGITVTSPNAVTVNCKTSSVNASQSASVTAPAISLGASGQSLLSFVTSAFMALFNGHTHPDPQGGNTLSPTQQMNESHMTTTVKGG